MTPGSEPVEHVAENSTGSAAAGASSDVTWDVTRDVTRDVIEIRGLIVSAYCGVLAEEQARPQPLEADIDLFVDLRAPGASDDLADTVDYASVCSMAARVLGTERFDLLERAAARIAEVVLEDRRVAEVAVAVRKLRPPVPELLTTIGVRIRRTR